MVNKKATIASNVKKNKKYIVVNPISEEDKSYARTAVRLKMSRAIWKMWDRLRDEEGLDQNWLVERLGSNKGRVSRLLNGSGNWTLDTIADLLEAMEGRLTIVEVKRYKEIDYSSCVTPSIAGLRDHPNLWNIIIKTVDDEDSEQSLMLDASTMNFTSLGWKIVENEPV